MSSIDLLLNKIKTCVGFKQINKFRKRHCERRPSRPTLLSSALAPEPPPFDPVLFILMVVPDGGHIYLNTMHTPLGPDAPTFHLLLAFCSDVRH